MFSTATLRAVSPLANAADFTAQADADASRLARHTRLQAATSVDELLAMIPSDYRLVLTEPLRRLALTVEKLLNARATLQKWEQHSAAGTLPPFIRQQAPVIQLTKAYSDDAQGLADKQVMAKLWDDHLKATLDEAIKAKTHEVTFLERAVEHTQLYAELAPLVEARRKDLVSKAQMPVLEEGELGPRLKGWTPNPAAAHLGTQVLVDVAVYAYRVMSIVEAKADGMKRVIQKKKEIAQQADVEMADATRPGPSLQSLIDKAVDARLKKMQPKGKKQAATGSKGPQNGKKASSTSQNVRAPPPLKKFIPPPARKLPRATGPKPKKTRRGTAGAQPTKQDKGKGKAKA